MAPTGTDVGEIERVGPGLWSGRPDGPLQILVRFGAGDPCGIIFAIDERTLVTDARPSLAVWATPQVLEVGATVLVAHTLVNQSCPGQSRAEAVSRLR